MKIIALIGHSASGKSAYLEARRLDRATHDFDKYALHSKLAAPGLADFERFISSRSAGDIVVLPNRSDLLLEIQNNKEKYSASCAFVYMKRNPSVIRSNLSLVNTDGLRHTVPSDFDAYYRFWDDIYAKLADVVVAVGRADILVNRDVLDAAINDVVGHSPI